MSEREKQRTIEKYEKKRNREIERQTEGAIQRYR